MDVDTAMERITEVQNRIQKADRETDALEKELKKERGLLDAVSPYQELHFDISRILHFKEVRFRFGRLPVGYYERLKTYAYDDACTIFEKCKETEDYVWGVYFVPAAEAKKVDAIYASLHFERIHLEDAYEGTVDEACRELKEKTDALEQQITAVRAELAKELNGMSESISAASKTLAYESKLFDVRKLAAFTKAKNETFFILCGWMENKEADLLKKELEEDPDIFCTLEENPDRRVSIPPTRLKNPKLIKPFEMFIQMYGLPNYQEFDPTLFVALSYSIIFGAIFAAWIKELKKPANLSCRSYWYLLLEFPSIRCRKSGTMLPLWKNPSLRRPDYREENPQSRNRLHRPVFPSSRQRHRETAQSRH